MEEEEEKKTISQGSRGTAGYDSSQDDEREHIPYKHRSQFPADVPGMFQFI